MSLPSYAFPEAEPVNWKFFKIGLDPNLGLTQTCRSSWFSPHWKIVLTFNLIPRRLETNQLQAPRSVHSNFRSPTNSGSGSPCSVATGTFILAPWGPPKDKGWWRKTEEAEFPPAANAWALGLPKALQISVQPSGACNYQTGFVFSHLFSHWKSIPWVMRSCGHI